MHKLAWAALVAASFSVQADDLMPMDQPLESMDKVRGVIRYLGNATNGLRMCFGPAESVGSVRQEVEIELQRMQLQGLPTPNQVLLAMSTRYPCPFSPYGRAELRPAARADLEGTWLMPETSMKLFLPPSSPSWQQERIVPMKCEVVGFLPEGESRTAELRGAAIKCPDKADEFATPRALPRVVSWDMPSPGRIVLTRTDVPGHVEEWEAFVVQAPFEFAGVSFKVGDLIEYARKHPKVQQPFAYRFRHLQRLP